jgi:hypothetical protein
MLAILFQHFQHPGSLDPLFFSTAQISASERVQQVWLIAWG